MRKLRLAAACLAALCMLSGCGLLRNSYVSVAEHNDPYAYKESAESETTPLETEAEQQSASNYYAILSVLRSFVANGVEHGTFRLESYRGDVEEDLRNAFQYLQYEDPLGAFAVDQMSYTRSWQDAAWLITVDASYRRSTSEIEAIRSVRGNDRAIELIEQTLSQLGTTITLQISGYQDEDLAAAIRHYCLEHPNVVVCMPDISAAIYPESGNVRVVELHLGYAADRETLRSMQAETESVLSSADRYARYAQDDHAKLNLIYSYLTSRFPYVEDRENGSVYGLLCEGVGNSESFASITAYLCQRIGVQCLLVEGTRQTAVESEDGAQLEELPYVWNIVQVDGVYYHVDLQADALAGRSEPQLLLDDAMSGYAWDKEVYPVCDGVRLPEAETP